MACQGAFGTAHTKNQLKKNIDKALEMIRWGAYSYCFNDPVMLFAFGELNICGIPGPTIEDLEKISDYNSGSRDGTFC